MELAKSIVEYFSGREGYKCGYCKSSDTNVSHGMWAHSMTPDNYQSLINRGWRRSGCYMYKPSNEVTCCPMYTIKCAAAEFTPSRSQKKVIKKFIAFLKTGQLPKSYTTNTTTPTISSPSKKVTNPPNLPKEGPSKRSLNPEKAKNKRRARRIARLLSQNRDPNDPSSMKHAQKNARKSLEDYLGNADNMLVIKHFLAGTEEFKAAVPAAHALYKKYQMKVHGDSEDDCAIKQFKRFLCDTPLIKEDDCGTYHDHYYVKDKLGNLRLIGVGVVDVLPSCLSSVYFFYDPDLTSLSLGTLGALLELQRVRSEICRPIIRDYYMGFYIHSCAKMRYKGNFSPSFLLCHHNYTWHTLDQLLKNKLDHNKYIQFNNDNQTIINDINKVMVLQKHRAMSFSMYKCSSLKEKEEIQEYCNLVGQDNASKILLYRSA